MKNRDAAAYRDEKYTLTKREGLPYLLIAGGEEYRLTCHPYEPCLYVTDGSGDMTAVHNAFDPESVLHFFRRGETVTSITGREYTARDFCEMVEYAAGRGNIGIEVAEKVFGDRPKKLAEEKPQKKKTEYPRAEKSEWADRIVRDERFEAVLAEYPDCVVDYCIVIGEDGRGRNAHWMALLWAARELLAAGDEDGVWSFDVAKAEGKPIPARRLISSKEDPGGLSYRRAFLHPPHENGYTAADFDRVNAALFPNGMEELEVYEWTTDWSDYFDEGHEWWGALCLTVYDKSLDRFAVILASATD